MPKSDVEVSAPPAAWLKGGGTMGERIRSFDWSSHPMGPIERWPQSLRTALGICLDSRYPMAIWWGPRLCQLYNDGYIPVLGDKHPRSLGQRGDECWAEIWDVVGPIYERVVTLGESTFASDLLLLMERNRYLEETYFTFSYSPIRDEAGGVGGNLITCTETTQRVISERRLSTLRDLGARAAGGEREEEACARAVEALAANPWDIPFALLYLAAPEGHAFHLAGSAGVPDGSDAAPAVVETGSGPGSERGSDRGWPLAQLLAAGGAVAVQNLAARFDAVPPGPWPDPPECALLLPLGAPGQDRPTGALVAGVSRRRVLDTGYRDFLRLVASQIASAIANARAYEEERRRAEALAELDRAKTVFFSNVSHEFRTPLTLLLGPLQDLLDDDGRPLPAAQREHVETAQRNALRLLKLVNTLLDFSRIEAGRTDAVYEPTDLAALTRELASVFRSAVERAGLTLTVDCETPEADDHEAVYVDREMWEKIVLNLLSNAFKFTLEGEIAVRLRHLRSQEGDRVELTVSDTGAGIPAEEIPHLFERFRRVKVARARSQEGTGIGLALVHELVKLHGGAVRVESEPGRGSSFTVAIPAGTAHLPEERLGGPRALASTALGPAPYVDEALRWLLPSATGESAPTLAAAAPLDYAAERPRILLADDNADMRDYLSRLLSERWQVEAVADGQAALAAALAAPPDLVLADVMMPGLDGFELLRALRSNPATRALPILLLSARAGEEARVEGLEAGADDYLVKPFSARELVARIAAQLEAARLRGQIAESERVARRQAEADSRAKDQFLAMLSHELRNPLGAIRTAAHTLEGAGASPSLSPEAIRHLSRIITRQSRHLTLLLDDLLDVARVTAGKIELRRDPVNLAEIAERCLRTFTGAGLLERHRIEAEIAPAWVEGDATRLEQVVSNLLENAVKYTPAGGLVRLRAERRDGEAVLRVEDTGVGIPAEILPHIFDLFVQGERTLDRSQGGLGLGLTLVRQLVEKQGGRVEASSPGPGLGSAFEVRLPVFEPEREPAAARAEAGAATARDTPRRILLIEDNADSRESLQLLLQMEGHQVETAGDGRRGLELARELAPDLVLVDIGLPGLNGYQVAQGLASHPERGRMRVVALTGYGQESDHQRSREAGFDLHLVKPVEPARLRDLLS